MPDGLNPDWLVLGAALTSGLLGGVHCAAMCGGIATGLSFGQRPTSAGAQWLQALQPNLGRVFGYALAGVIVGGFGHGLARGCAGPRGRAGAWNRAAAEIRQSPAAAAWLFRFLLCLFLLRLLLHNLSLEHFEGGIAVNRLVILT